MRVTTAVIVCLVLSGAALADPYLLDRSVDYVRSSVGQRHPVIVAADTMFLAVWADGRGGASRVFATRIRLSGQVMDPAGIMLPSTGLMWGKIAAAFDGTNFLVVFQVDAPRHINDYDIYGVRLNQAGEVLDSAPIPIATEYPSETGPSVAFNGQNYLVVWDQWSRDGGVWGRRVSPSGQLLDTAKLRLSESDDPMLASVASDGVDWFVVWDEWRSGTGADIYGARVRADGTLPDAPDGFPVHDDSNHAFFPAVAYNGENYLMVCDLRNYTDPEDTSDVVGVRVTSGGEVLDSVGIRIAAQSHIEEEPTLAFDGTNCLVAWEDDRGDESDLYFARVTSAGEVLDPGGIPLDTAVHGQTDLAIAYAGGSYLVGWSQWNPELEFWLVHARVSPDAVVLDTIPIPTVMTVPPQSEPAVCFTGEQYLAVWRQWSGEDWDICGQRLDRTGMPLDTMRFPIAVDSGDKSSPVVAFDGANYLVAWGDDGHGTYGVYAVRITPAGVLLDSIPFRVTPGHGYGPSIAFGDSVYVLGWRSSGVVHASRLTPDGTVLDSAGITIYESPEHVRGSDVAFDGRNFMLVWGVDIDDEEDIYAARLSSAGVLIDSIPLSVCCAERQQREPKICWGDSVYMLVWHDWRHGHSVIYAARVTSGGVVLDSNGFRVQELASDVYAFNPDVIFDGAQFGIAWEQQKRDSLADIYGALVTPQGSTVWSGRLAGSDMEELSPTLAPAVEADFLLLYSGWAGFEGRSYNTRRIWGLRCSPSGVSASPDLRTGRREASLVRGAIHLEGTGSAALLDITGRRVARLQPGANDIRHLAPGVYFVVAEQDRVVSKVILQR